MINLNSEKALLGFLSKIKDHHKLIRIKLTGALFNPGHQLVFSPHR